MTIDQTQTPTDTTNPTNTVNPTNPAAPEEHKPKKPSCNNDNSNPQQGTGGTRQSTHVKAASHPHSLIRASGKIPPTKKDARKLFVGGLPSDVTSEEFRTFFGQFGVVIDNVVMFDRETHRSRGFGFVTFEDPDIARRVLSMGNEKAGQQEDNNKSGPTIARLQMRGKTIEVKTAEPKESSMRRYDERRGRYMERAQYAPPCPMDPNMMMMMYGHNDPNLYYNYNIPGMYYVPPPFAAGYMAPMYYPEQMSQQYPYVMPMVERYPLPPVMETAYACVPFPTDAPMYHQPCDSTPAKQPVAPDTPAKEGSEVEGGAPCIPSQEGSEVEGGAPVMTQ